AVWPSDPAAEAQALTRAVWAVGIPDDDRVRIAHFVVERATALGLTVFDDQLGMAFLPSGQVLPPEKAEIWAGLTRELAQEQKPLRPCLKRCSASTPRRERSSSTSARSEASRPTDSRSPGWPTSVAGWSCSKSRRFPSSTWLAPWRVSTAS